MTFLDIEKLLQDRTDLIEIISRYRELTQGAGSDPMHRRYLACHLERLNQLEAHIAELRKLNATGCGIQKLLPAA